VTYADLSPPQLFSLCARGGDPASWDEFIRRFNPVIGRSVIRVAIRHGTSDKALIDDLVQETYLKICADECKLLRTFTPRQPESAFGFLKVVAASVARDFFKSLLAEKRAPEASAESLDAQRVPEPDSPRSVLTRAEREVLIGQIDRRLKGVVPPAEFQRIRTVFWLYYRSGFTASAIASLPTLGLTTKGVESLLLRATRLVRDNLSNSPEPDVKSKKGFQQAESF
jgi:RNA polymerase sigma-70 factor (ECF subfamily)